MIKVSNPHISPQNHWTGMYRDCGTVRFLGHPGPQGQHRAPTSSPSSAHCAAWTAPALDPAGSTVAVGMAPGGPKAYSFWLVKWLKLTQTMWLAMI